MNPPDAEVTLELVATIASRLLPSNTRDERDFDSAAERALMLVEKCYMVMALKRAKRENKVEHETDLVAAAAAGLGLSVPWGKLVKFVTGEKRPQRAEEKFQTFYRKSGDQGTTETAIVRYFADLKDKGTGRGEAVRLQNLYQKKLGAEKTAISRKIPAKARQDTAKTSKKPSKRLKKTA